MKKVLLDTDILLDYLLGRDPGCAAVTELLSVLYEHSLMPYVTSLSLKDVFYLVSMLLKRMSRESSGGTLTEQSAAAAQEVAWACVRKLLESCLVVPMGSSTCLEACTLRSVHEDFEDDLQLAAAREMSIDIFVTADMRLMRHAPIACMSAQDACALLRAELET